MSDGCYWSDNEVREEKPIADRLYAAENRAAALARENDRLSKECEWFRFLVNSLRLPLGIDPTLSNLDRDRILPAMQAAAMSKQQSGRPDGVPSCRREHDKLIIEIPEDNILMGVQNTPRDPVRVTDREAFLNALAGCLVDFEAPGYDAPLFFKAIEEIAVDMAESAEPFVVFETADKTE